MNNDNKKPQADIESIVDPVPEKEHTVKFTEANTKIIREIKDKGYGATEDDVVIVALGLLYSISKVSAKCEFVNITDENGKLLRISIPKIG